MKAQQHILVITGWEFKDALVQAYTLPYVKIIREQLSPGSSVTLVTMERTLKETAIESGIDIVQLKYIPFGIRAVFKMAQQLFFLRKLIYRKKITTIHAWCTPAGMTGYLLSVITGRTLVIDSYEPHADAMVENGAWKRNGSAFRILSLFEKLQTRRAKYLIAAAPGMKEYALQRYGHRKENILVKPACVDLTLFSEKNIRKKELVEEYGLQDKVVCVYAGKIGGIYLEKEIFDFFHMAENIWPGRFRALLLSAADKKTVKDLAEQANLHQQTIIHTFVPHGEIAAYIGLADFALTPVKPVPSKKYCSPVKDGEYWALGLPVVITPDISVDSEIILKNKIGSVLESLDNAGYQKSLLEIKEMLDSNSRNELYNLIHPIAVNNRNFQTAEEIYKSIYGG